MDEVEKIGNAEFFDSEYVISEPKTPEAESRAAELPKERLRRIEDEVRALENYMATLEEQLQRLPPKERKNVLEALKDKVGIYLGELKKVDSKAQALTERLLKKLRGLDINISLKGKGEKGYIGQGLKFLEQAYGAIPGVGKPMAGLLRAVRSVQVEIRTEGKKEEGARVALEALRNYRGK